jgi:hypothetical protein
MQNSSRTFRIRSSKRDAQTDLERRERTVEVIDDVLKGARAEQVGLRQRIEREALVPAGGASPSSGEAMKFETRLRELDTEIARYESMLAILREARP